MLSPLRRQCIEYLVNAKRPTSTIPGFLLPAFCSATTPRPFSSSPPCASRIGAATISLPPEVNLRLLDPPASKRRASITRTEPAKMVEVEGPLGKMVMQLPPYASLVHDQTNRKAVLSVLDASKRKQREMWGTTRAYLHNHVLGVSEGHTAILRLVGVGFRASIESSALTKQPEYPGQEFVSLKVGYSHPIELGLPKGVKASTPQPTRILLEGVEKEVVMQFAAKIRMWRKPEPYKGKGIFVNGETIKLKAKKIT
ncbi:MAG: mitochondrial 54S ribosomal 16 [Lasallia pustulata]|uniref:Mitochondrial 54S ribosomal 16 n=2 Tax=Lasallia pustulata TaxID=136370 RepID=A0A5M8PVZ5_9LECA|nr:MAG: mitochondrial 54S ribosomal 16 [Lasallia pustulata]